MITSDKHSIVRADQLWKELLESFLYFALEIFYPQLYTVVNLGEPPLFLNKELRVPGLHKASKEHRILDILCDIPLKTGKLVRLLLEVNPMKVRTPILRRVLREREKRTKEWIRAEAEAAGVSEEIVEGIAEKMKIARRMFDRGMELNVIADLTDFSMEELNAIVK